MTTGLPDPGPLSSSSLEELLAFVPVLNILRRRKVAGQGSQVRAARNPGWGLGHREDQRSEEDHWTGNQIVSDLFSPFPLPNGKAVIHGWPLGCLLGQYIRLGQGRPVAMTPSHGLVLCIWGGAPMEGVVGRILK